VAVTLNEAVASQTAQNGKGDATTTEDKGGLGISAAPLTPALADRLNTPKGTKGVVVQDVNPVGRAADAGLQPGDIIQQVNRQPVESVEDLRTAVGRNTGKPTLLLITRGGHSLFVTVRPNA
jgi:serine protease Do